MSFATMHFTMYHEIHLVLVHIIPHFGLLGFLVCISSHGSVELQACLAHRIVIQQLKSRLVAFLHSGVFFS